MFDKNICTYTEGYSIMTKTISISDEAYERLSERKRDNSESFSQVIVRLMPKLKTFEELRKEWEKLEKLSPEDEKKLREVVNE